MSDYSPVSFKYITGWGDASKLPDASTISAAAGASIEDIKKMLRKQGKPVREGILAEWKKLYRFYAEELLDEETQAQAINDGYLKDLSQELDC